MRAEFRRHGRLAGKARPPTAAFVTPHAEKRLLQAAVAIAGAYSLFFGTLSVVRGVAVLAPAGPDPDLDSHFRYLSGIFLCGIVAFYSCIPDIENKGPRFRLLGCLVVAGGVARLLGAVFNGLPGTGHLVGLALELIVTPSLLLWQARLARRFARPSGP